MEPFLVICPGGAKTRLAAVTLDVLSALALDGDDLDDWQAFPEFNRAWFESRRDWQPRYLHLCGQVAFSIGGGPVVVSDDHLGFACVFGFGEDGVAHMRLEGLTEQEGARVYAERREGCWHYVDFDRDGADRDGLTSEQILVARPSFFGVFAPAPVGPRSRLSALAARALQ